MVRAYTSATALGVDERYDLRLQRRNQKRLSVAAGSCALVSLFFIAWVFHHSWNIAFRDDAPSNSEEAVLKRATMLALAQQRQGNEDAGDDLALRRETRWSAEGVRLTNHTNPSRRARRASASGTCTCACTSWWRAPSSTPRSCCS